MAATLDPEFKAGGGILYVPSCVLEDVCKEHPTRRMQTTASG
jgi:hypothetical protein